MLNKTAEVVLKCIVQKSKGNLANSIYISHKDFKEPNITNSLLNAICRQLYKEGYIGNAFPSDNEDDYVTIYLNFSGYSYFENKRKETGMLLLKNVWLPIMVSVITTLIVIGIEEILKKIW